MRVKGKSLSLLVNRRSSPPPILTYASLSHPPSPTPLLLQWRQKRRLHLLSRHLRHPLPCRSSQSSRAWQASLSSATLSQLSTPLFSITSTQRLPIPLHRHGVLLHTRLPSPFKLNWHLSSSAPTVSRTRQSMLSRADIPIHSMLPLRRFMAH